jgi:hypothetical protein
MQKDHRETERPGTVPHRIRNLRSKIPIDARWAEPQRHLTVFYSLGGRRAPHCVPFANSARARLVRLSIRSIRSRGS